MFEVQSHKTRADMERRASSADGPRLAVACAAVRRMQANKKYIPRDYELCLVREGGSFSFPSGMVSFEQDPARAALDTLRQLTSLSGVRAHPLTVHGKPCGSEHVITLFYAVPVSQQDTIQVQSSVTAQFHSLAAALENEGGAYQLQQGHREMVYTLDQWLRERHTIPFVNLDLLFFCSKEGEGVGGFVKAIIDNPLYSAPERPPEDNLVIALNNPVFQMNCSQDVDTAVASNA